jgi:hypothetical protein
MTVANQIDKCCPFSPRPRIRDIPGEKNVIQWSPSVNRCDFAQRITKSAVAARSVYPGFHAAAVAFSHKVEI